MSAPTTGAPRAHFVDLMRLIALLQMVNGHTLDAVLRDDLRGGPGWDRYLWYRGLVSVAFMIVAGIAFHLTTLVRWDAYVADTAGRQRRVRRALEIIAIGYLLRFPFALFGGDAASVHAALERLAQIDVLHCIGASLLLLEGLTRLVKRREHVVLGAGALATLFVTLAPLTARLPVELPVSFATGWASHEAGSLFPVFPWSAYVLFGVVLGWCVMPHGARTPIRTSLVRLGVASALVYGVAWLAYRAPFSLFDAETTSWSSSPAFFALKLSAVILGLGALAALTARLRQLPWALRVLSGETLPIYVVHIVVLYWSSWSVHRMIGRTLDLGQGLLVSSVMVVLSFSVGLLWHAQKAWRARRALERRALPPAPSTAPLVHS